MTMNYELILSKILKLGERMLIAGGEVSRVEDTIERLCRAYGMDDINVFTITSSIVVTVTTPDNRVLSQTRRIRKSATDFTRIEMLNDLSRELCAHPREADYIEERILETDYAPDYPQWMYMAAYALIASSFTIFFGGKPMDGVASALVAILIRILVKLNRKLQVNYIVSNLICSLGGGIATVFLVELGVGISVDKIIIGNIMLLIPGIALTNALRDMINGDIMAGSGRLCEAVVVAIALAVGFTLALLL